MSDYQIINSHAKKEKLSKLLKIKNLSDSAALKVLKYYQKLKVFSTRKGGKHQY
jgi:hypothetical protein